MFRCIIMLFSFFLLSIQAASASPCSPQQIKQILIAMKLDPSIKNNQELLESMQFIYGEELTERLKEKHPYIEQNFLAPIDSDTLDWLTDIIWDKANPFSKYLYIPADLSNPDALAYFVLLMDSNFSSKRRMVPVMKSESDTRIFHNLLTPNGKKSLRDIMHRLYPSISNDEITRFVSEFQAHYGKFNDVKVNLNFQPDEKPVIVIAGHSTAGNPNYILGAQKISTEEMVSHIVTMGLPANAIIKLMGCFTACTVSSVNLSIDEIETKFLEGKLHEITNNGQSINFLALFAQKLELAMPHFAGRIDAYLGKVVNSLEGGVLTKQGTRVATFAVLLQATDGEVLLKREHARVSYKFKR